MNPDRRTFLRAMAALAGANASSSLPLLATPNPPQGSAPNPFHVRFTDVTKNSGIHFAHERAASEEKLVVEIMGPGCAWLDYNQDGFLDAFFVNSGRTPNFQPKDFPQPALYRNNGDGTFTDVSVQSGIRLSEGFYIGVAIGDYDNDGFPDIYITGYGQSKLFHNNKDGTFSDVSESAGVTNPGKWATAAAWFDYDHDGFLDLLVTNYISYDWKHDPNCGTKQPGYRVYCDPFHFQGSSMRLYKNNRNGTFSDVTEKAGLVNPEGKSLGVVVADFDGDGWDDILIANDGMRSFLYFNNRNGTFRDVTYESGAGFGGNGETESGMGIDAADVMGHGRMDFYVCHMDNQLNRLYENRGDGTFSDVTLSSGLGYTNIQNTAYAAAFIDWDNDGNRDLLIINGSMLDNIGLYHPASTFAESKRLYRNIGAGKFVDSSLTQDEIFLSPRVGRGLAVGDFDNNGSQDFLQSNNGQLAQLFQNSGSSNHWLGIKLIGTQSNRDAIGAQVRIRAGDFVAYDQVRGGGSYCSSRDLRIYFGLGSRLRVDELEVRWPSSTKETFRGLSVDQILSIREGQGILSFQFPKTRPTKSSS
jgi:hypothetical protein